jgi:hypothetical protein
MRSTSSSNPDSPKRLRMQSLQDFAPSTQHTKNIVRMDIDRVDVDNFTAVYLCILQRRELFGETAQPLLEAAAAHCKVVESTVYQSLEEAAAANHREALASVFSRKLHVVLNGRRFSSKFSPMIQNPVTKLFELEILDDPAAPQIVSIEGRDLGKYIKQADWESRLWNPVEEQLLLGLSAAQLRAFLAHAGVYQHEFDIYDGAVAAISGLSSHVHALDFKFLKDPTCVTFEPTPASELSAFNEQWRAMSQDARSDMFTMLATAPSAEMRSMSRFFEFERGCDLDPTASIVAYIGGPLTAMSISFSTRPDLARRVSFVCAMSGAWEGTKNLLGTCFNNAVDIEASKQVFSVDQEGRSTLFPNARILLIPTETCKQPAFTVTSEQLTDIAIRGIHKQWTDIKRAPQPLFDVLTVIPLMNIVANMMVVPVTVVFGKNQHAMGTFLEDLGMALQKNDNDAHVVADSPFLPGIYATLPEISEDCATMFLQLLDIKTTQVRSV